MNTCTTKTLLAVIISGLCAIPVQASDGQSLNAGSQTVASRFLNPFRAKLSELCTMVPRVINGSRLKGNELLKAISNSSGKTKFNVLIVASVAGLILLDAYYNQEQEKAERRRQRQRDADLRAQEEIDQREQQQQELKREQALNAGPVCLVNALLRNKARASKHEAVMAQINSYGQELNNQENPDKIKDISAREKAKIQEAKLSPLQRQLAAAGKAIALAAPSREQVSAAASSIGSSVSAAASSYMPSAETVRSYAQAAAKGVASKFVSGSEAAQPLQASDSNVRAPQV